MKYNRKQRSSSPIDILKFETVETGAVFKQYDVNTSILEISLVANGEPVIIDNSFKIYATVKPRQRSTYDVLYRYSENYEENETSNYKVLLNAEKMKVKSLNNMINLYLSPLALSFSGDMVAELILVDLENQQRVTSQEFTFKIEPSLTPNQEEEISYTVIEDLGGTYITDSEELKLLAIDGVSGFKLSFTGSEVNEILQSVQGLNYEENNEALESLNQKDEEIQESIKAATKEREKINSEIILLKNKDLELDTKIEQLNLYNSTNDLNINEIKSDLSKLEEYNSSNDIKIQTIDREIESLKEYDSSNSTKIQSIENEMRSLKKYDETNTSSINKIKEDVVNLKSYNSSNDESIKNINSNIESLKQYNSNNTGVVNGIKSDLQNYKSSNNQAVSNVRENLESYKTSNNQSVNSINENLESFKNTTNQTVNDINVDISSLKDYNTTNDSKIEEINGSIERNTNSISENLQKINSNTSLIEVNKKAISSINLKNEEIERDLTSSKENIENNKNSILNLNKKVNKNTEDIKLLKEGSIGGSSSNSNKEVIDARTATTGEKFDTLDERIDCEVDRLNKKIEVSFLQQEDKENHVIENTVEGMTTDMVIKGRTLQNFKSNVKNHISSWVDNGDNYSLDLPSGSGQPSILYGLTQTLKENQKYTVIVNLIEYTSGALHFSFMSSDGSKLASTTEMVAESKGVKKFVFTTNDTTKAETLRLLPRNGINNIYSVSKKILILEGDWTNKPITQYFEGIKSFGQQEDKISILSHGKNLLNINNFTDDKFLTYNDGSIQELREGRCITEKFYKLPQNIVLSSSEELWKGFWIYDSNFNFIRNVENPNDVYVTRQSNEKYYRIGIQELRESILSKKVQLEERTIKTEYEPYKDDKKDILLQNLGFDEGLRGINDISDELNSLRNVAIKRIGKREYREGDELLENIITDKTNTYYVLEEPIETPLTENINVKTYGERTYFSFENSISGTSSFKAPVDTTATIARLNKENRALEEENKTLRQDFESTTLSLTDSDLELVKQNVDMDFRLTEVEFALDIPQAILSSNIKFKNKKGEVKSMARTPYEMMKIVILSGDYDREDYIHKVGKYYERGRMTKDERDELMSLMTADEVISKKI